jgi:phosphoribosylglycinamide formyltransferase-1
MVSGGGTNLQAIIDRINEGAIKNCRIVTVVASKPGVYALDRAARYGIPSTVISKKSYDTLEAYDKALIEHMKSNEVDLVVLAGFLSLLGRCSLKPIRMPSLMYILL